MRVDDLGFALPKGLDDMDAAFMTQVLRHSGAISASNEVVSQVEKGVGMTAGYFSAIKKVYCTYKEPSEAPRAFVVKAWPQLEIAPKESIRAMFIKDIKGYQIPESEFYPRPITHLAAFDADKDQWALVMEDADAYADHKVHESELTFDEVMAMIPGLVDVAVAWEGCDSGDKAEQLADLGVDFWAASENIANFKALMPGSAMLFDRMTQMAGAVVIGERSWDDRLDDTGLCEKFTRRIDAFLAPALPESGGTCTLSHGDLRGDNLFFCPNNPAYPAGWLCIDFQQMFRGPVPSDLAYLMSSGSVLPEAFASDNLHLILRAFYNQFMAKTRRYPDYRYDQFADEFAMMSTVPFTYYLAFGVPYYEGGAYRNEMGMRVELGGQGAVENDLTPEEMRQRMWWRKSFNNFCENFRTFGLYDRLQGLPENLEGLGVWNELPDHLR